MDTSSQRTRRTPWALGIGGLAIAAVAAVAVLATGAESPSPNETPGGGIGSCVETYSDDALANREFAFDGTVTAIDGDSATFIVNEAFKGDLGESITLQAPGMTGPSVTSAGGPSLAEGERYLVAGDDEFVWGCGFTQPYDEGAAAEWADATR